MNEEDVVRAADGSIQRYNGGKPALHLIPVTLIHSWAVSTGAAPELLKLLFLLARWQRNDLTGRGLMQALSPEQLRQTGEVLAFGARKYELWGWAKGMPWSVPLACLLRHVLKLLEGVEIDDESGLPHWGHVGANLVMLAHYSEHYLEGDDRPLEYFS